MFLGVLCSSLRFSDERIARGKTLSPTRATNAGLELCGHDDGGRQGHFEGLSSQVA